MKFKRINENVIRCVVSKEEMYHYGLEVSELVDNRDKAEDFLRRVMQEARYELNYKTNGGALSVQIALLPEGDVAMTIAEAMPEQLEAQMNRLKSYLEDFQKVLEGKVVEHNDKAKEATKIQSFVSVSEAFWVECESLEVCLDIAKIIDEKWINTSKLYSYKGAYYFRMEINDTEKVGELFLSLCEFGQEIFLEHQGARVIYEHGKCIIDKDAIETLKIL